MSNAQRIHEVYALVKELAIELGRTPKITDLEKVGVNRHEIDKIFGGITAIQTACGLTPNKRQKVTNDIFKRDLITHLEAHDPKTIIKRKAYPRIAALGDLHEPFSHAHVKQDFKLFVTKFKPDYIIQVGDAMDQYCASRFARSHNIFTPKQEEETARKNLEEFWAEMGKAAPEAKRIQLVGNHDLRSVKRTVEVIPALEHWIEKYFKELLTFDGVETVIDPREEYIIDDIAFHHGYRSKLGDTRDYIQMNAVLGHTHTGGVVYRNIKNAVLWELNCGLAADPTSKGLSYTNQKMNHWTLGWGAIDEYGPRFIPY